MADRRPAYTKTGADTTYQPPTSAASALGPNGQAKDLPVDPGAISMMAPTIPAAVATMIAAAISSLWPGGVVIMRSGLP